MVVSGSYVLTKVIVHELGHCLGLFHTHRGTFFEGGGGPAQCPELVNGSNSAICGDYVTDTPADPNMWSGCTYIGTGTDANGQTYSPLTDNIMSYVAPACLQSFTTMQIARMHTAIDNSSILQNVMPSISGSNVICTSAAYTLTNLPTGATVIWSAIPSSALIIDSSGSSIVVTRLGSYNGEVTLTATMDTPCGILSLSRDNIVVGSPSFPTFTSDPEQRCAHLPYVLTPILPPGTVVTSISGLEGGVYVPLTPNFPSGYIVPPNVFGISITLQNSCGSSTFTRLFQRGNCL